MCAFHLSAAEIYQWRDENGNIHFSDQPQEGADSIMVESQNPDAKNRQQHLESQKRIDETNERLRKLRNKETQRLVAQRSKAARAKLKQKQHCEQAMQRLRKEQDSWKYKRRKGYKQRDKTKHLQKQAELKYNVKRSCGG
jgi:acetoin utilization deacetylase AcuC-like enzyme